jgi:DNA-binding transcriptional regulator WhiA
MKNQFDKNYSVIKENALTILRSGISLTKASKLLKLDRQTLTAWGKSDGLKFTVSGKKPINSSIFDVIDNEDKAYWLGFLYADGYVSDKNHVELTLKLSDEKHIQKFKEFLSFEGKIYKDKYRVRICFKDINIGQKLKMLGCTPRKSLTLTFPNSNQVPSNLINHFIRGYFDGDGSINDPEKCSIGMSMIGTKCFLSDVLEKYGIEHIMCIKNSKGSDFVFQFQLNGNKARFILNEMYKNATVYLDRKKERYDKHLIRFAKRKNYLCQ